MGKKKLQYVLLIVTCTIWGLFGYRIYVAHYCNSPEQQTSSASTPETVTTPMADTFSLIASYRDPFLGPVTEKNPPVKTNHSTAKIPVVKAVKQEQPWPPITYQGMIRNQQSNKLLAIVYVNGKNTMLNAGEVFEEVKVCRILKDSIEVMYGKQKKYILKQNG